MKLIAFCIPTYKRPATLRRGIESVARQVEEYGLADETLIYVTDDASPDDTAEVLAEFAQLDFFTGVTRDQNLGMNQNIRSMLGEAAELSEYQFILTDDDYLQPGILPVVVEFLRRQRAEDTPAPIVWTPRYSYTEDGELHTVICSPFDRDTRIEASARAAGRYMFNGFILSGLILQASAIDYDFWGEYGENAYFPILVLGDLLARKGAYYWHENLVHHTVLNECHWERWGKNDAVIDMRLFSDFANAYGIMRRHLRGGLDRCVFYLASFPSIYRLVSGRLVSGKLNQDRAQILAAVDELRGRGLMKFDAPIRLQLLCALGLSSAISLLKLVVTRLELMVTRQNDKRDRYARRIRGSRDTLSAGSVLARSVFR